MSHSPMPTCGILYRLFEEQCQTCFFLRPDAIPHGDVRMADRSIGHMRGQAEKVFLGACMAFMIRPGPDWWGWALLAMEFTCEHYGLAHYVSAHEGELWGCQSWLVQQRVHETLLGERKNSPAWHQLRGSLCGIPTAQLDLSYHQRDGYGRRCEPSLTTQEDR